MRRSAIAVLCISALACAAHGHDTKLCAVKADSRSWRRTLLRKRKHSIQNHHEVGEVVVAAARTQEQLRESNQIQSRTLFKAKAILALCATLYGHSFVVKKYLQPYLPSEIVTFLTFLISSLCYMPSLLRFRGNLHVITGSIELGLWLSLAFIAQAIVLEREPANKVAFYAGLSVAMTPLIELAVQMYKDYQISRKIDHDSIVTHDNTLDGSIRQRRSVAQRLLPPLIATCGAVAMECGGMEPPQVKDLQLLITPFAFSMGWYRADEHGNKYKEYYHIIAGSMLCTITVVTAIWTRYFSPVWQSLSTDTLGSMIEHARNWKVSLSLLYLGVIVTAWTASAEQYCMNHVDASEVSLIFTLEPILATVFAAIFLHEAIEPNLIIASALIVSACVVDFIGIDDIVDKLKALKGRLRISKV